MGIIDLLQHLPGVGSDKYHHSFYDLKLNGKIVPFDAACALWQFAVHHAWDHLRGNHSPALMEWARFLVYLRSICRWSLKVYMDGMENKDKSPEIERRKVAVEAAKASNNLYGQIKNTPDYIAKAVQVCQFLNIEVHVAVYEADMQVSHISLSHSLIPVSGDSDLLAYGVMSKLILVKGYKHEWYCIIDLEADVPAGEYPLFDLYRKHGRIVFQLYAACCGFDFTTHPLGIARVG